MLRWQRCPKQARSRTNIALVVDASEGYDLHSDLVFTPAIDNFDIRELALAEQIIAAGYEYARARLADRGAGQKRIEGAIDLGSTP